MLTENFFDSDGVRLHYIDWGGSGRPVVLLAGLGGTAQLFRGLAPRLAERFRVAALTRRGHGRSDRPDAGYDLDTMVDDIRRFLDTLEFPRAALVGHSWAGIEITRFATSYPDRVEAVVYLDALQQFVEPRPDIAADPALAVLEKRPTPDDLVSPDAYLAYYKRSRPDLAAIWCEAIAADRLDDMTIENGRPVDDHHGNAVSAKMVAGLGSHREPAYGDVRAPALAFVRAGRTNPFLSPDAPEELRRAANTSYVERILPWLRGAVLVGVAGVRLLRRAFVSSQRGPCRGHPNPRTAGRKDIWPDHPPSPWLTKPSSDPFAASAYAQLCPNCTATPRMSSGMLIAPSAGARFQLFAPILGPRSKPA